MNRFSEAVNTFGVKAFAQISSPGPSAFIQLAGEGRVEPYPFVR
jgi:hypothetical protein